MNTYIHPYRQTDIPTDKQADIKTDRQTRIHTHMIVVLDSMFTGFFSLKQRQSTTCFPFLGANYASGCTECARLSGWRLWAHSGAEAD